jgi:hypothetical protein
MTLTLSNITLRMGATSEAEVLRVARLMQVAPEMQELLADFVAAYNGPRLPDLWSYLDLFAENARSLLRKAKGRT